MYLKRLESIGFKSFAEHISVDFVPGVTAVVGPNGSGKSNITDAIRWVLGEQSARSLRGGKMEDIIFAGSDSRKPLNFAEVGLTLSNEDGALPLDYDEVNVVRRVYRSGDSEFFINKQSCRLKDIIDLFMDSGLGREAFSIISQGRVEEILNSKSDERRTIFEEAAGVLKYKNRKKKAEGKLTETEGNLYRVRDILGELEGQVEPLGMQASVAKDFLEQKEELKRVEVAVIAQEIEELHLQWQECESSLEKLNMLDMETSSHLREKEAAEEQMKGRIHALDDSISNLQQVLLETSEALEKVEGQKGVLQERQKNAETNQAQMRQARTELEEKLAATESEIETRKTNVNTLEADLKEAKVRLQKLTATLSHIEEGIEDKIESLKSEYIERLNEQARSKHEKTHIDDQRLRTSTQKNKVQEENSSLLQQREQIEKEVRDVKEKRIQAEEKVQNALQNYKRVDRERHTLEEKIESLESQLYRAYQFLQQTKSKKEMLEAMEEEYAGFFQGVKEVLKARESLQGVHGAVAELIQVDEAYKEALEMALGAALQHVVVEDERIARESISFLKKNRAGRATFLPLSTMKARNIPEQQLQRVTSHSDWIGVASDLVTTAPIYESIVKNLLGMTVVSKTLQGANAIASALGHRYRVVTLEGDVVNAGGSMSGGAQKKNPNSVLSRKKELESLQKKLAQMEKDSVQFEDKVKSHKQRLRELNTLLQTAREDGEALRLQEQAIKGDEREVEARAKSLQERLRVYDLEQNQLSTDARSLEEKERAVSVHLKELEATIANLDATIQYLTKQQQEHAASKEQLHDQLGEVKIEVATKREQLQYAKERFETMETERAAWQAEWKKLDDELRWLTSEMNSTTSGESELEISSREKAAEKERTLQLLKERRKERMDAQESLEQLVLEAKELRRQHRNVTEQVSMEQVRANRVDVELETKLGILREEYELSFELAKVEFPLQEPLQEAKKQVKLIKRAIEELGTVNLGAIEEFERVHERYTFLLEQKDDLEQAKATLHDVIEEMDEEMEKRFATTFYAISSQFEGVFQALFGGGRAELRLTDPNDLLETGVDIVAQPPGKKLTNLGLLSGGERALTAIALLFSILKVRPVPFCVLDEVEAALDEANVARFSHYLKQFSKETQFIVITHRKGTMEGADVLYGVTMQESGVSKLVSVKLEERHLVT